MLEDLRVDVGGEAETGMLPSPPTPDAEAFGQSSPTL